MISRHSLSPYDSGLADGRTQDGCVPGYECAASRARAARFRGVPAWSATDVPESLQEPTSRACGNALLVMGRRRPARVSHGNNPITLIFPVAPSFAPLRSRISARIRQTRDPKGGTVPCFFNVDFDEKALFQSPRYDSGHEGPVMSAYAGTRPAQYRVQTPSGMGDSGSVIAHFLSDREALAGHRGAGDYHPKRDSRPHAGLGKRVRSKAMATKSAFAVKRSICEACISRGAPFC